MKQNLTTTSILASFLAVSTMFTACNQFEKTPSGMAYKIAHGSGKEKIKQGNVVKFNLEYKLGSNDSVIKTTYGQMPGYLPVDTAQLPKHNFTEILTKLVQGDKVDFVINIDTLKKMGLIPEYDNLFKKGGTIKGKIEILKIYANETASKEDMAKDGEKEQARMQKEMAGKMKDQEAKNKVAIVKQKQELQAYAAKNGIKVVESPLGVLVEVQNAGAMPKADTGKVAMLMYKGYFLDGKVFDSNMGADAKHKDPIEVSVGKHNTIPGFEDGVKFFGKGGKGRLLIPAALAYGDREANGMPANSNLIFDIEVVDVK
jgi:FKBP-type peptidyl-prolyl cis-trans isomerase FkpA